MPLRTVSIFKKMEQLEDSENPLRPSKKFVDCFAGTTMEPTCLFLCLYRVSQNTGDASRSLSLFIETLQRKF